MSIQYRLITDWLHAIFFETPFEQIKYLKQLQDLDDQNPDSYLELGGTYLNIHQYDKAAFQFEKALELHDKWNIKLFWGVVNYLWLGDVYHATGRYKKEKEVYNEAEKDFPDDPELIGRQASLALLQGNADEGNTLIRKYKFILNKNSTSEVDINSQLGWLYSRANNFNKSEEYFRLAVKSESANNDKLNDLAYFLIDKDRNIEEGIKLADEALRLSPVNYNYLYTKGWGLFKKKEYLKAREILQKSWDLRREKGVYDYDASLHLEEAKKAIVIQKNN